jgi:hypothetical protein
MILKKTTLIILLITSFITSAFAQRDSVNLNTLLQKTVKYASDYPIEKVYLHLDKPYYAANDTIWFKGYVTIDKHIPSGLSTNLYVDITNNRDSTVRLIKLPIAGGVANGNIVLTPGDFPQGNYHIRAYTGWMRNFDPDYFFNKNIAIGNSIDNAVKTNISFNTTAADGKTKINADITYNEADVKLANKKVNWTVTQNGSEITKGKGTTNANGVLNVGIVGTNAAQLKNAVLTTVMDVGDRTYVTNSFALKKAIGVKDVQFFPEGGELVNGIRSRVAFKAIGIDGLGLNIKGNVVDNAGTEVALFESKHLGMGLFAMVPEEGKSYKANITFPDGSKATYNIPRALPAGINLAIYNIDPANLTIKISSNAPYFQSNQNKTYYLVAQMGGAVYYAAQTTLQTPVYSAVIPKSKFPTGLIQFTLFSKYGSPISERLVFVKGNDALSLNMATDKKIYNVRQNVKVTVSAKANALPVTGSFSVSVVDETKTPYDENNETTILSNLLLTSDVKGYIEKPNYYFLANNENAATDLDVLTLTQGYRRISYSNILNNKFPQLFMLPEQQGIEVTGVLRNNTGLPISKGSLLLQIPGKASVTGATDMSGNFRFSKLSFRDSSQLTLSARGNANSKNLVLSVNGESIQGPSANNFAADEITNIDSTFKPYLANSKKRYDNLRILKEVVIKATVTKRNPHVDYSSLSALPAEADQYISKESLASCGSLLTCLPSIAMGITADQGSLYLTRYFNNSPRKPVQIYVDGKPVDANFLNGIAGKDVETIEVFYKDGLSGIDKMFGTLGIMSVTMKKVAKTKITLAQLQEMMPPPNILTFMPFGYAVAREFYSPRYTIAKPAISNNDLRTTIYWNPKVTTDKVNGTASFDFFNADGRGTYRATIEGIDSDGNLGRQVIRYTVK